GWTLIGGLFKPGTVLSAVSWGPNALDVFGIGADGGIWHKAWRGGPDWNPAGMDWEALGGECQSSLGVAEESWEQDRVDLVGITGASGRAGAYHKAWRGGQGWSPAGQGWESIGGSLKLSQLLALTTRAVNRMDIAGLAGGNAWSKGWYGEPDWDP